MADSRSKDDGMLVKRVKKRRNSGGQVSKLLSFWKSVEKKKANPYVPPNPRRRRVKTKPKKHKDLRSALEGFNVTVTKENGENLPTEAVGAGIRTDEASVVTDSKKTTASTQSRAASVSPPPPPMRRPLPRSAKPKPPPRPKKVSSETFFDGKEDCVKKSYEIDLDDEDCLAVFGGDEDEEGDVPEKIEKKKELTEAEKKKMAAMRMQVEAEIVSSEEVYVNNLDKLITTFVHPMKAAKDLVDPADVLVLFSNIELLSGFHQVFLADLKKKEKEVHVTFQRMADFLKMYTQYVNGYENAMSVINTLNKKKGFKKFLEKKQATIGQSLMSFLIMPVQRIPRYVLLLRELIKNTLETDPHIEPLRSSLSKVQDIAAYVNEQKRQMESRTTLLNISQRLSKVGSFELFKPDRHLVKKV